MEGGRRIFLHPGRDLAENRADTLDILAVGKADIGDDIGVVLVRLATEVPR